LPHSEKIFIYKNIDVNAKNAYLHSASRVPLVERQPSNATVAKGCGPEESKRYLLLPALTKDAKKAKTAGVTVYRQ